MQRSSCYRIFGVERSPLTAKAWTPRDAFFQRLEFAEFGGFQAAYGAHDNRLLARIIALHLAVPHLLTIAKSIPNLTTIIKVNHSGKDRKPSCFFKMIWMKANTSR
jgi:hypothetical protein